jgi:hypothetical protein
MNESRSMEVVLQRLTPAQQRVAAALLQGATVKDAAESCGVHRTTVHGWSRTNETFRSALEEARRIQAEWVSDEVRALVVDAFAQLQHIILDKSIRDSIRLQAALAIIDRAAIFAAPAEETPVTNAKLRAIRHMLGEAQMDEARRALGLPDAGGLQKAAR